MIHCGVIPIRFLILGFFLLIINSPIKLAMIICRQFKKTLDIFVAKQPL